MWKLLKCIRPNEGNNEQYTSRSANPKRTIAYVELIRQPEEPLGLLVAGGADRGVPIYIEALRPGGVGARSRALQEGDQILAINGTPTDHLTDQEAIALLQNVGTVINLEIAFEAPSDEVEKLASKSVIICFQKEGKNSFGFTIRGGRTENRPVSVAHVRQGSLAYRQGTLQAGDRIMKINSVDIKRATHAEALALLRASDAQLTLEIEFDVTVHDELSSAGGPLLIEMTKPVDVPLGITLSGAMHVGDPIWLHGIRDAGRADRSGALHVGDRLLSINGISLEQATVMDAIQLLLQSDVDMRMEIVPAHMFSVRPGFNNEVHSDFGSVPWQGSLRSSPLLLNGNLSITPQSVGETNHLLSHPDTVNVEVVSDAIGFGFSLRGGATEFTDDPLIIDSVYENGPAERLGQVQAGDRVRAINGIYAYGLTLDQATKLIRESGETVAMEIEFDVADTVVPTSGTFDVKLCRYGGSLGITINGNSTPGDPIWINKLKKGGVAYRIGSLKPGDVILAINEESLKSATLQDAAALLKSAGSVVTLTVSKDCDFALHMDNLTYTVELQRQPGEKFGFKLNGSDDPNKKIIISEIKPNGPAARSRALRVGDCIVAVNDESVVNKTLSETLELLQSASETVSLKINKRMKTKLKATGRLRNARMNHFEGRRRNPDRRTALMGLDGPPVVNPLSPINAAESSQVVQYDTDELSEPRDERDESPPLDPSLVTVQQVLQAHLEKANLTDLPRSHDPSTVNQLMVPDRQGSSLHDNYDSGGLFLEKERKSQSGFLSHEVATTSSPAINLNDAAEGECPDFGMESNKCPQAVSGRETHEVKDFGQQSQYTVTQSEDGVPYLQEVSFEARKKSHEGVESKKTTHTRISDSDIDEMALKTSAFIKEINRLANSESSDPESDTDRPPLSFKKKHHNLPPRMADKFLEQMKAISTPTPVEMHTVELVKSEVYHEFGFSLSEGLYEPGVFVRTIKNGSLADLSGKLQPFDRILKINQHVVTELDCKGAVHILEGIGNKLTLVVARNPFAGSTDHEV